MNIRYKQLFDELIINKMQSIIIRYIPDKHNYTYQGYSHQACNTSLDDITNLVIDDMVFYAFSEKEIVMYNDEFGLLKDLRQAAKYAYIERLPHRENSNSDGLLGEVLLDLFIQTYSTNAEKLVIRAKHTEIKSKKEITGYDALYFTKDNKDGISFWLGQAKAGDQSYCKRGIRNDLIEKYKVDYFADTAFYIADRKDTDELDDILVEINRICFNAQIKKWDKQTKIKELFNLLKTKNIKIKIPCLITYTKDIYNDSKKLKFEIENEVKDLIDYIDNMIFPIEVGLEWEIIFWVFPVKDVNYIRNELITVKKEAK